MALLETLVLGDVVQVVAADDHRAVHVGLDDRATQNTAADRHVASERALLVDVVALSRLLRHTVAETVCKRVCGSGWVGGGVSCGAHTHAQRWLQRRTRST